MQKSVNWLRPLVLGVVGVAWTVGCASRDPADLVGEPTGVGASQIQGGTTDTIHAFAVGIAHAIDGGADLCSGVLLAPNLVATARHCVSPLDSPQVDCATSKFGSTLPASSIFVTAAATIAMHNFIHVTDIIVPPEPSVCGNDIALLILATPISLPLYVTPTIDPPMTDHHAYTTAVTAIGFGVNSPENGRSAGVRRIRENINLVCIPNDNTPNLNCLSDQQWLQTATANEFQGGDGTCEGDSGSGAFEQANFNKGSWVAFGVLSRGGVAADSGKCVGSIYSRFDAWPELLIAAAQKAASVGGYGPPSWASAAPPVQACMKNGASCSSDTDCCSMNCTSHDKTTFSCVACDCNNTCNTGYSCQRGLCVAGADSAGVVEAGADSSGIDVCAGQSAAASGGCTLGPGESGPTAPWQRIAASALVVFALCGRRLRRGAIRVRLGAS